MPCALCTIKYNNYTVFNTDLHTKSLDF